MTQDRPTEIQERVFDANLAIVEAGLVKLTWGNVSEVDREAQILVIKPSGVPYETMRPQDMVAVSLADGTVADGGLRPSSDTATHRYLYRHFGVLGCIVHTHSHYAVAFAQAGSDIPCYGTTHADHFRGEIPATRDLTPAEIAEDYETNTGKVIAECFEERGIDPAEVPGVLVSHHGPFAWGPTPEKAVENAIVLEEVARLALHTTLIRNDAALAPHVLVEAHFLRKHGSGATYGQEV